MRLALASEFFLRKSLELFAENRNMSCWVVPTIAAELWGVSVQHVMDGLKRGDIPSKNESGFTFVDVAPESPKLETPRKLRPPPPPTYTVVTHEEIEALIGDTQSEESDDEATINLGDWREARRSAGQLRQRPIAA